MEVKEIVKEIISLRDHAAKTRNNIVSLWDQVVSISPSDDNF